MKITRQVFIDANIFTYLLTSHPVYGRSCQNLLEKVLNDPDLMKSLTSAPKPADEEPKS